MRDAKEVIFLNPGDYKHGLAEQKPQHHLEDYEKYKCPGPTVELLNLHLTRSPGDPYALLKF